MTPLVLGDVSSPKLDIKVDRVGTLISHVGKSGAYDAAETSFSRYTQMRIDGDESVVGIPNFIMRGFRHRCVITTKDSPITSFAQLAGKRIGVTGWRDSGNTWTRAALRREGVGVEDAMWYAGRLTEAHPITDRLDGFGRPGRIEAAPGERPMMDLLKEGLLDAIFTPFMPDGYFAGNSGFRQVLSDFRGAEHRYFADVGYVPGMHLIGLKAEFVAEHPWVMAELSALIDESQRMWLSKRRKYADTTPFMLDELLKSASELPEGWDASGFAANRKMIGDFASELHVQGILPRLMTPEEAIEMGAMALFGEKYGDEVRVVSMGSEDGDKVYSLELCGGTHVNALGDIGLFKVVGEGAVSSGVRRIEALTGEAARNWFAQRDERLREAAAALKTTPDEVPARVVSLLEERKRLERELAEAKKALAMGGGSGAPTQVEQAGGAAFIGQVLDGFEAKGLRGAVDEAKQRLGSGVAVLVAVNDGRASVAVGVTDDLVTRFSAVELVKRAVAALGGQGGGGRPDMAQGGGPDATKADEALAAVRAALDEARAAA